MLLHQKIITKRHLMHICKGVVTSLKLRKKNNETIFALKFAIFLKLSILILKSESA